MEEKESNALKNGRHGDSSRQSHIKSMGNACSSDRNRLRKLGAATR